MKHSLEYIVRSWIFNLDVTPYAIGMEEATEFATYITPDDTDDTITAEAIMELWNRITNEYLSPTTDLTDSQGGNKMDNYKDIALRYAEKIGVYEYSVNGKYMEYWSMFDEGFYFFRTDLDTLERTEVCFLHWVKDEGIPVPAFLKTPEGYTKYNYFAG